MSMSYANHINKRQVPAGANEASVQPTQTQEQTAGFHKGYFQKGKTFPKWVSAKGIGEDLIQAVPAHLLVESDAAEILLTWFAY